MSSGSSSSPFPNQQKLSAGARLPPDVLSLIAHYVHAHLYPAGSELSSLDPLPTTLFSTHLPTSPPTSPTPSFLTYSHPSSLPSTSPTRAEKEKERERDIPFALPSTAPSAQWPQHLVFRTLLALTRTSSAWRTAALPALFSSLQITYPRSWLALLDIVCGPEPPSLSLPPSSASDYISPTLPIPLNPAHEEEGDENEPDDPESDAHLLATHIAHAATAAFVITERRPRSPSREDTLRLSALAKSIREQLAKGSPGVHIPPELLSPPESREGSPAVRGRSRGRQSLGPGSLEPPTGGSGSRSARADSRRSTSAARSPSSTRSPSRWRLARRVSDALQEVLRPRGVYVPALTDLHPGKHIKEISFAHFRTIHMRLPASTKSASASSSSFSAAAGVQGQQGAVTAAPRFVTPQRLLRLLREVPELRGFGGTEYMDSALEVEVLEELLLRGIPLPGGGKGLGREGPGQVKDAWAGEKDAGDGGKGEREDRGRSGGVKDLRAGERERRGRRRWRRRDADTAGEGEEEQREGRDDRAVREEPDEAEEADEAEQPEPEPNPAQQQQQPQAQQQQPDQPDPEDLERWAECAPLEALDLCGCVSPVCVAAIGDFVRRRAGAAQAHPHSTAQAPGGPNGVTATAGANAQGEEIVGKVAELPLLRLGMAGMSTLPPSTLEAFVLLFPKLRMLDISGTHAPPSLLIALSERPTLRLRALSLARCPRLTGASVLQLLLSPACEELEQLSLFGDDAFPSPLSGEDVETLVRSPLLGSGRLTYLDLSSAPLTPAHLLLLPSQTRLRTLGLSYMPDLPLSAIRDFLLHKAPNVEILSIVDSCSEELGTHLRPGQLSMTLHGSFLSHLCTPPFSFSSSPSLSSQPETQNQAPTRLRVIEPAPELLSLLGEGAPPFRPVRSRGRRSWYVDSSSTWVDGVFSRSLPAESGWRRQVEEWALARGNVGTGVGWGSRKMEVLGEGGMEGRGEGLYGMVGYAYAA